MGANVHVCVYVCVNVWAQAANILTNCYIVFPWFTKRDKRRRRIRVVIRRGTSVSLFKNTGASDSNHPHPLLHTYSHTHSHLHQPPPHTVHTYTRHTQTWLTITAGARTRQVLCGICNCIAHLYLVSCICVSRCHAACLLRHLGNSSILANLAAFLGRGSVISCFVFNIADTQSWKKMNKI